MDSFEERYGIVENEEVKKRHRSRRMFAIVNGSLKIAEPRVEYSHAVWFVQQGWIKNHDDPVFYEIVRGNVDKDQNIYFYVGYDFDITEESEKLFFTYLSDLVRALEIKSSGIVSGGLVKAAPGVQWLPQKTYGTVEEVLKYKIKKMIYLDYAAAAPLRTEVREAMKVAEEYFANPSSVHDAGKKAQELLENSRENIKKIINAKIRDKVIFTSTGTESVNLAIKGVAFAHKEKGNHIITSKLEHKAVLETCKYLEKQGFSVTYLEVDNYGQVDPAEVEKAITPRTILISIMYANNEVGTIQPLKEIAAVARNKKVLFHTDACQAGYLDLDLQKLGLDLLTLNSNKIYGPKGAGLLYIKEGIGLQPLIHGGGQEYGLRSGTENVPAIVGFAKALELAQQEKDTENKRLEELRDYFITEAQNKISGTFVNGHAAKRLANNVHLSFEEIEAGTLLLHLNLQGIYASAGSACTANEITISHVLKTMKISEALAGGSIRFSLGKYTSREDIDKTVKVLIQVVSSLRKAF